VNALLASAPVDETSQTNGVKNADDGTVAATTVNDPVTGPLVVKLAVTEAPTTAALVRSNSPLVFAGRLWVEKVPWVELVMPVTVMPADPIAKPPCWAASEGSVMFSVYAVPLPEAVHVSPVGAWITAPEVAAKNPAVTDTLSTAIAAPANLLMVAPV
jgi:hypothetical protein